MEWSTVSQAEPSTQKHPVSSCQTLAMFQASNSFSATMLLTVSDAGLSCHTSYIQTVRRSSVASLSAVARARLLWTCSLIGSRKCSLMQLVDPQLHFERWYSASSGALKAYDQSLPVGHGSTFSSAWKCTLWCPREIYCGLKHNGW